MAPHLVRPRSAYKDVPSHTHTRDSHTHTEWHVCAPRAPHTHWHDWRARTHTHTHTQSDTTRTHTHTLGHTHIHTHAQCVCPGTRARCDTDVSVFLLHTGFKLLDVQEPGIGVCQQTRPEVTLSVWWDVKIQKLICRHLKVSTKNSLDCKINQKPEKRRWTTRMIQGNYLRVVSLVAVFLKNQGARKNQVHGQNRWGSRIKYIRVTVIALNNFQTGMTSIRWRKRFMETGHINH